MGVVCSQIRSFCLDPPFLQWAVVIWVQVCWYRVGAGVDVGVGAGVGVWVDMWLRLWLMTRCSRTCWGTYNFGFTGRSLLESEVYPPTYTIMVRMNVVSLV